MSFDLKKYLANNPLLNEGLSNQEQMVVDDILSVTEGPKDVYNKLVSYGKKGLISLAVLSSVLVGCAEQGDMDSAKATIEYAIENEWAGSEEDKLYLTAWYETSKLSSHDGLLASLFFWDVIDYNLDYAQQKLEMDRKNRRSQFKRAGASDSEIDKMFEEEDEYINFTIQSLKDNPTTLDRKFGEVLVDLVKTAKEGKDVGIFSKFLK